MMDAPRANDGVGFPGRFLRGSLAVIAVGAICSGPVGLVMLMGHVDQKSDRARMDLYNLENALKLFRDRTGAWPDEEGRCEALVAAQILERCPPDSWDHAYQYRLEAVDGGEPKPVVTSLGKDGVAGTEDDLLNPLRSGRR